MSKLDLNLLFTLDALLSEGSVAGAAKKLRLSPSAMSRALSRLRETTGDPLLVRAGRGVVPTPRALDLRDRVRQIVENAAVVLRPADQLDLEKLSRSFTIRTSEGFVENFGARLISRVSQDAPSVRLHFIAKPDKDSGPLRDGAVDLETGVVVASTSPEIRAIGLFRDRYVGVVRLGHPLSEGTMTTERYASGEHILVSRSGLDRGPIDDVLETLAVQRNVVTSVGGFSTALALARSSDLIATVPERHTDSLRLGLHSFPVPFAIDEIMVSLLWHPRMDADPAHRWLRSCVREVCGGGSTNSSSDQ